MFKKIVKKIIYIFKKITPKNHKKIAVEDTNTSIFKLTQKSPFKRVATIANNKIINKYDLEIIVPAYNVENYITDCLDCLLHQHTKFTYHVTIIDDGSSDSTLSKITPFTRYKNFVLKRKDNGGLSSARNLALTEISGKYLTFFDSDDLLDLNFVEKMMTVAIKEDADMVQCNLENFVNKTNLLSKRKIKYSKANIKDLNGFAGGFVCKSILFQRLCFPEGYWFEDTICSFALFPKLNKVYKINQNLYKHRINKKGISFSSIGNYRTIETIYLTLSLLEQFPFSSDKKDINGSIIRRQFVCNVNRLSYLDIDTQLSAYSVMYNLMRKLLDKRLITEDSFTKIFLSKKYYAIRNYCRYH